MVGKYPPIEGGVSAANYWLAYGLAEQGHEVYLVTNAGEVEDDYRMHLSDEDRPFLEPSFDSTNGFVRLIPSEPFSAARMEHIPRSNPFVSKLAALATQAVRQFDCEVIYAFYYEPYGVAGYLASLWTGRPLVLRHAGSDLDRLMRVPGLATTYKEILRSADVVVTRRRLVSRFLGMGVPLEKIFPDVAFGLPHATFNPEAEPLAIPTSALKPAPELAGLKIFDPTRPSIGIYGKIGVYKGSFDLIHALAKLRNEGYSFNFLCMCQGRHLPRFITSLNEAGLSDCTSIIPFQPHWRVPQFIRACDAVCFLERDFPVKIHGPAVPREILTCGSCLVLSGEIANKQFFKDRLRDGHNMLLVDDPKNHDALAAKLEFVIRYPEQAREIGLRGTSLTAPLSEFTDYINGYRDILLHAAKVESPAKSFADLESENGSASVTADVASGQDLLRRSVHQLMPWARLVLGDELGDLQRRHLTETQVNGNRNRFQVALGFLRFLEDEAFSATREPYFGDLLRYQKARLSVEFDGRDSMGPTFGGTNRLTSRLSNFDEISELRPLRSPRGRFETFSYDVTQLFKGRLSRPEFSKEEGQEILNGIRPTPITVYFHPSPNFIRTEFKVNSLTEDLLELCDGSVSSARILRDLAKRLGSGVDLDDKIFQVLVKLYDLQVIIFTEDAPRSPN